MASIMALRASRTGLQADVRIGTADDGNYVTVQVKLDRIKNDELANALAPLESYLTKYAEDRTQNAAMGALVEKRAKVLAKEGIDAANARSSQRAVDLAASVVGDIQREAYYWQDYRTSATPHSTNPKSFIQKALDRFRDEHGTSKRREAG